MMSLYWFVLLIMFVALSDQTKYLCDPNSQCGCSTKPASIARIVNGENAVVGSWGWMVSLNIDDGSNLCGGSILSSSWIITAAHCVDFISASSLIIYAGSNNMWSGTQNRTVTRFIKHPNYQRGRWNNDLALLELSSPLDLDDPALATICIPSISSEVLKNSEWPEVNTNIVAIGWGYTIENGRSAKKLKQVTLQTVDYREDKCKQIISNKDVQFCAGVPDDSKDTCGGDSGGPVMIFTSQKQWVLAGLTSYGRGCARPGFAGVYTRIAVYEDWIKQNTNQSYTVAKNLQNIIEMPLNSSANIIIKENEYKLLSSLLLLCVFIVFY